MEHEDYKCKEDTVDLLNKLYTYYYFYKLLDIFLNKIFFNSNFFSNTSYRILVKVNS